MHISFQKSLSEGLAMHRDVSPNYSRHECLQCRLFMKDSYIHVCKASAKLHDSLYNFNVVYTDMQFLQHCTLLHVSSRLL